MGLRKRYYKQASGVDGITAERFKILKDDAIKSASRSMPANLENSAMDIGLEKNFIPIPKKGNAKECSYCTSVLISHASKVMLKILQARLSTESFQMFKLDLEKAEEPEIKLTTSIGS